MLNNIVFDNKKHRQMFLEIKLNKICKTICNVKYLKSVILILTDNSRFK